MKRALICGAGGFIGGHLTRRLKSEGYFVRGSDIKRHDFDYCMADEFIQGDLRDKRLVDQVVDNSLDEIYQLAADMGGAGYIFTGQNDAHMLHNSALCSLNVLNRAVTCNINRIFYASSACVYPLYNQKDPWGVSCSEDSAYPAYPDSAYGWEKLFSERLYDAYARNFGIQVRIGRFHNIFGPYGAWRGGREKAPAALCRKIAQAKNNIEIWGDGKQTRSFLYIDDCIDAIRALMQSNYSQPINIGSEERISINKLAKMIMKIAKKPLYLQHVKGQEGVRGRSSDNKRIKQILAWSPKVSLYEGLEKTYKWIEEEVKSSIMLSIS